MSAVSLAGIQKSFGGQPILKGIDLEVPDGQLLVLVGPSGCGKSTLLRTIAGLELPDAGTLRIGERDLTQAPPRERDVGMVFQSYALYPHLTVRDNLGFGLKLRRAEQATLDARVKEVAGMLGLEALLERFPRQLSGGQRQRVAMGRAIARRPGVFLFDEPLSNLDAALRAEVRVEIKRLHERLGATMIYVTHDQVEAMTLADQLVVLREGRIEQQGPPLEVYDHPRSRFVASFLGSPPMSFLDAEVQDGRVRADGLDLPVQAKPGAVLAGIRPHDVVLSGAATPGLRFTVDVVEAMGFEAFAHGRVGEQPFVARVPSERATELKSGDLLALDVAEGRLRLFEPDSGAAL